MKTVVLGMVKVGSRWQKTEDHLVVMSQYIASILTLFSPRFFKNSRLKFGFYIFGFYTGPQHPLNVVPRIVLQQALKLSSTTVNGLSAMIRGQK
jgi:hypothetical protein